jgi:molecular chaperone DnaJ
MICIFWFSLQFHGYFFSAIVDDSSLLNCECSQAVLGGRVQVPTLTGDVVLKIRPGTQPGQMQVLRGKGIKMLDSNQYGDQYVHINVIIPMNISQRQQMLMQDFAREEKGDGSNAATGSG